MFPLNRSMVTQTKKIRVFPVLNEVARGNVNKKPECSLFSSSEEVEEYLKDKYGDNR
jgi:hypothetical protein